MQNRRPLSLLLLAAASSCNCGGGAIKVVVLFPDFKPGCLEVSASDAAGGEADSVQLDGTRLANRQAVIGIGPRADWSPDVMLRVRSFEGGCDGPVLEEISRSTPLAVQPGVIAEWEVTLTAVDADRDAFAAARAGVSGTDCDDNTSGRHPGAAETCGVTDMNCDGRAGCIDPLCNGASCDDGVAGTILDACQADAGCSGRTLTQCVPGTWVATAGTATTDPACSPCASGTFTATSNASSCTAWNDCIAGQFVVTAPSSTADRLCALCGAGFYTAMPNSSSCAPAGTCAPGTLQTVAGTMTSPVECATCTAGNFCAGGSAAAVPCASGTWDDDASAATACVAWSVCSADTWESAAPTATSDRGCSNFVSCLDRLTRVSGSTTGNYLIDPDGTGVLTAFTVRCNMTLSGGGWTVISFEDFASSAMGWSDSRRDTSSTCFTASTAMLGGYNVFGSGVVSTKAYPLYGVQHTQVRVALDYFVIDSWDNERARVSVDGAFIFDAAFTQGGPNVCGAGFGDRGGQGVVGTTASVANVVTVSVTSTLDQPANDESFGIDNVLILIR